MKHTSRPVETLSNRDETTEEVGEHQVIEQAEMVPGEHPEPHLRTEGQTQYLERYLKCVDCGVEVLRKRDFPDTCELGVSR